MKCEVLTRHVAAVPGYEKIYLHFTKPQTGLERLLASEFNFGKPKYVGGKEPKYSLYVGHPEQQIIEGTLPRQWSPSYKKFSWRRFWDELRKENQLYKLECRCGVWNKNEKVYLRHRRHCSVMKEFKKFLDRIENYKTFQDAHEHDSKRKEKKTKVAVKRRNKGRTNSSKETEKKVVRRSSRRH